MQFSCPFIILFTVTVVKKSNPMVMATFDWLLTCWTINRIYKYLNSKFSLNVCLVILIMPNRSRKAERVLIRLCKRPSGYKPLWFMMHISHLSSCFMSQTGEISPLNIDWKCECYHEQYTWTIPWHDSNIMLTVEHRVPRQSYKSNATL